MDEQTRLNMETINSQRVQNRASVDANRFLLPDMGDFYLGAVDDLYLKKIDQMVNDNLNGDSDGNGKDAAFYTEIPPYTKPGLYDGAAFVKTNVNFDPDNGFDNGNTIQASLDDIEGDSEGKAIAAINEHMNAAQQKMRRMTGRTPDSLNVRLLGIDCYHPAKWCHETDVDVSKLDTTKKMYASIKDGNTNYIFDQGAPHENDDWIPFVKIGGRYREYRPDGNSYDKISFSWCLESGDGDDASAKQASQKMADLIQKGGNQVYFLLDTSPVSEKDFPTPMTNLINDQVAVDQLGLFGSSKRDNLSGYNRLEDPATRFVGNAYIKIDGQWVNLAKAALCDNNDGIAPSTSYHGLHPQTFEPKDYDKDDITYADAYFKAMDELDSRRKIQKEIFGINFDSLNKWTVTLGDVTLFVPPTNITINETIQNKRAPILRAHGSMTKTGHHSVRTLILNIYFNEDRGINGYAYATTSPNGKEMVYQLNSLRSLIAQTKFIPFIPIDNDYINQTLGIDAVTVQALSVNSVEGFPRLLEATLQLQEFDYASYVPELLVKNVADLGTYRNWFATAFNWDTMRWYYQRPIMNGDDLSEKDYDFNSDPFYQATLKNRTMLMPFQFKDSTMTFYIANQDYLDQMLEAKMELLRGKKTGIDIDDREKQMLQDLGRVYDAVNSAAGSPEFQDQINTLNQKPLVLLDDYSPNESASYDKSIESGLHELGTQGLINADEADEHINAALDVILSKLSNVTDATGKPMVLDSRLCMYRQSTNGSGSTSTKLCYALCISVDPTSIATEADYTDLKKDIGTYLNLSPNQFFNDGKLFIPISVGASRDGSLIKKIKSGGLWSSLYNSALWDTSGQQWGLDTEATDMKFLAMCSNIGSGKNPSDIRNAVGVVNVGNLENMQYDRYDAGTVRVRSWSAAIVNHYSNINLEDINGSCPQYLGGDDTMFNVMIETTDRDVVKYLTALPQIAADYARRYHFVIPCWPMRIDSEFTRFFGCFDMMLENVEAATSQDPMDKVYSLQLTLRSVDRTLRAKEALARTEASNSGDTRASDYGSKDLRSYFDITKVLGQAELYPDLELPTLEEMKDIGYDFIRYKFQDDRVYVDPDFYFIYPQTLTSQVIRETCMNLGKIMNEDGTEMTIEDKAGGKTTYKPQKDKGIKVTGQNDTAKNESQKARDAADAAYKQKAQKLTENLKKTEDQIESYQAGVTLENWDVCDDIRTLFLEDQYKKEIDSFISQAHANGDDPDQISAQMDEKYKNSDGLKAEDVAHNASAAAAVVGAAGGGPATAAVAAAGAAVGTVAAAPEKATEATQDVKDTTGDKNAATPESVTRPNSNTDGAIPDGETGKETVEKTDQQKYTEGKWTYHALKEAREASAAIDDYLKNTPIDKPIYETIMDKGSAARTVDKILTYGTPPGLIKKIFAGEDTKTYENLYDSIDDLVSQTSLAKLLTKEMVKQEIYNVTNDMINDDKVAAIFKKLNIETSSKFRETVQDIMYSAACAASSSKEYTMKSESDDWRPNPMFIGVTMSQTGASQTDSVEDAVENATQFGIFGIKMYDRDKFQSITGEELEDANETSEYESVNQTNYLLDPFFRGKGQEAIEGYKQGCITNIDYCTVAYFRLMLYWLKRLIDNNAIPAITSDVLRKTASQEFAIEQSQLSAGVPAANVASLYEHSKFFNKNVNALDSGKIWSAAVLASTDGSKEVLDRIDERDYRGLNGLVSGCSKPAAPVEGSDTYALTIRKMVLALVGVKRIKDINSAGIVQSKTAQKYKFDTTEKIYLDAADDPSTYIPHSCHDMIVHDARGRMLRAFPTFYLVFVDEGRKLGRFKLHDNFYNTMAVMDMQIVKSRKIAADTANITMSNFYNTYTTDNADQQQVSEAGFLDVFKSIYSPESYMEEQEDQRKNSPVTEAQIRLRPGVRIHIRMGYGSNAAHLPIVFNGVVAECDAQDAVQLICQGDGIELMNPIMDDDDASYVGKKDGIWPSFLSQNTRTPRQIMNGILTTHGGFLTDAVKDLPILGQIVNPNPYGIYHFGNPDFKDIIKSGEPTQNIFDAYAKPMWGDDKSVTAEYALDEPPQITFEMMNKTVWDCAHICKSVMPDFICGIAPFGFRSTLFIGAPRFYYAYDYYESDHAILERRKPYQQFHIYTSTMDIIGDGVKASSKDMKTVALGLYEVAESLNIKSQKRVGPLYVDCDIYPEWQKTMIVNTNLYGKGTMILGTFTNTLANDLLDYEADESGEVVSNEKIAWRMTASALKDSVKDMYCGDLIVMGDPTVKPHDRIYINDTYTGYAGQCTVKEVVHNFSADQGFTTTISPDVICAVDDPFELAAQHGFDIGGTVVASATAIMLYAKACMKMNCGPKEMNTKIAEKLKNWSGYTKFKNSELGKKAGEKAKDIGGKIASQAGKILKGGSKLAKFGQGVAAAGTAIGGVIAAPAVAASLAITAGVSIITSTVSNAIERTAKNLQVMTIYPIKRYGIAYTAGVEGSLGLVYGSPSFNKQGALTTALTELAGKSDNPIIDGIKGIFFDDDIRDIANKYKRDQGVQDADGAPTDTESRYNAMLKNVASNSYGVPNDYRTQKIIHQATTPKELKATYDHYAMLDTERFQNDPKLKNNSLISGDPRLKGYIDEGFLKILHETPELNKGERVQDQNLMLDGNTIHTKMIAYENQDGSAYYDLPMLNPNAIDILYEILRRTKNNMPSVNSSDPYESYDYTKNSCVILKSALRVGDKDSRSAAGFSFILEPRGNAKAAFKKAVADFESETKKDSEENSMYNSALFDSKELDDDEVAFTVRMPSYLSSKEDTANGNDGPADDSTDTGSEDSTDTSDNSQSTDDTSSSSETGTEEETEVDPSDPNHDDDAVEEGEYANGNTSVSTSE